MGYTLKDVARKHETLSNNLLNDPENKRHASNKKKFIFL